MQDEQSYHGVNDHQAQMIRERFSFIAHLVETLRAMNDTSLSDWRGVIGEELQKQRDLEQEIRKIQLELERETTQRHALAADFVHNTDLLQIEKRIENLSSSIDDKIAMLPFSPTVTQTRNSKSSISAACPVCRSAIKLRMRRTPGASKIVECESCGHYLQLTIDEAQDVLIEALQTKTFEYNCPYCRADNAVQLPDAVGAHTVKDCVGCDLSLYVSLSKSGISANITPRKVPEEVLQVVFDALPDPPWPKGVQDQIAQRLGLTTKLVNRAIAILKQRKKIVQTVAKMNDG